MSLILAIDLGKFNSVVCAFDSDTREASFRTIKTTPAIVRVELLRQPVVRVVIEACSPAGWVHDLCEELKLPCSVANTSGSLLTAEKAAQEKMAAQMRQLESDNLALRDDLGFFEKLLPAGGADGVSIRSLQAELLSAMQLKWQVLVIQPVKGAPDFNGKLDLSINGTLAGKPWTVNLPGGAQVLQFKQYRRVEGVLDLPPQAVVKNVSAKVLEGAATRAVQSIKL